MKYTAFFKNKGNPVGWVTIYENNPEDAEMAAGFWAACFIPNLAYDEIIIRED